MVPFKARHCSLAHCIHGVITVKRVSALANLQCYKHDAAMEPTSTNKFPCSQCGAYLVYEPGTSVLVCEYCDHRNAIPQSAEQVRELDFREFLARAANEAPTAVVRTLSCESCGASYEQPSHLTAFECPYCGTAVVTERNEKQLIKPESLLPFHINHEEARGRFRQWIKSLWFAPSMLKQYAKKPERLLGMYVPYWTYDCTVTTWYSGQRGDDYWVPVTHTTIENGKTVTKTRMERRTRWTPVSGVIVNSFNDILVLGTRSLPTRYTMKLEPWDLENLKPFANEYVSGFSAESYQIDLREGFEYARKIMEEPIHRSIRRDIGGDHQRISEMKSQYDGITFKHLLLPIWISSYRYKNEVYRFLVNGRTGEVQGERPWSWIKITLFVLAILVVVFGGIYGFNPSLIHDLFR